MSQHDARGRWGCVSGPVAVEAGQQASLGTCLAGGGGAHSCDCCVAVWGGGAAGGGGRACGARERVGVRRQWGHGAAGPPLLRGFVWGRLGGVWWRACSDGAVVGVWRGPVEMLCLSVRCTSDVRLSPLPATTKTLRVALFLLSGPFLWEGGKLGLNGRGLGGAGGVVCACVWQSFVKHVDACETQVRLSSTNNVTQLSSSVPQSTRAQRDEHEPTHKEKEQKKKQLMIRDEVSGRRAGLAGADCCRRVTALSLSASTPPAAAAPAVRAASPAAAP